MLTFKTHILGDSYRMVYQGNGFQGVVRTAPNGRAPTRTVQFAKAYPYGLGTYEHVGDFCIDSDHGMSELEKHLKTYIAK